MSTTPSPSPEQPANPSTQMVAGRCASECSEIFATTLRDIRGMVITIDKGTRVRVTSQNEEEATCTIHLTEKDNPTQIWNCIVGVPMKRLQFDSQTATGEAQADSASPPRNQTL